MKIKSRVDVITNSSTEVFTMKASDYIKVISENPKLLNESDKKSIRVFSKIEDLEDHFFNFPDSEIFRDLSGPQRALLRKYRLTGNEKYLLKQFGHTDDEIKEYEERMDSKRVELRDKQKIFKELMETAFGVWYDHRWGDLDRLKNYLEAHGIPFKYEGP